LLPRETGIAKSIEPPTKRIGRLRTSPEGFGRAVTEVCFASMRRKTALRPKGDMTGLGSERPCVHPHKDHTLFRNS
jgi:hypothetical protein